MWWLIISQGYMKKNENELSLDDSFPNDQKFALAQIQAPWYADFVNYLAIGILPPNLNYQQKNKFFLDLKHFYWDEPLLFKRGPDGVFRRCVPKEEMESIMFHYHSSAHGGHASSSITAANILQAGFYCWPTLFKDVHHFVPQCDQLVDNVSKWIEVVAAPTNDAEVMIKLFKKVIIPRFCVPRVVISDEGSDLIAKHFKGLLKKYGVKHKIVTTYNPQTSRQVEFSNREIKSILKKIVSASRNDCSIKLDDAL
ncbi:uncharacterized protein [Cicer arietinum]|uniref:uncharacterized protein n=1 Tax=Cicer arietinum TaxID=3827 RepID=UPI003CC6A277